MPLHWRDMLATLFVAVSVVVFAAWAVGTQVAGLGEVKAVSVAVLVLGIAASVSAVVPGFGELVRGSRLYLATTSALGVIAFAGGLWAFVAGEPIGLWLLVAATIVLWAMSTMRHVGALRPGQRLGHG